MSVGANRLEGLKVDLKIGDLWGARSVSGLARLARAEVAGQSVSDIKLTATGPRRFERPGFQRLRARPRVQGAWPPVRRLADPPRPRDGSPRTARAGRLRSPAPPRSVTARTVSPFRTSPCASIPAAFPCQAAPGRRLTFARPRRRFRSQRSISFRRASARTGTADGEATIGGTPGDPSGDWRVRLKQVSLPQTRSNALPPLDIVGAGRLARWAKLGRRHRQCRRRQFPSHHRIGAALERRRAGSQDRRPARRRSRQHRLVPIRPSHDRRSHIGARIARDHREASGARVGPAGERRIPRRPDGLQAHRNYRRPRRQRGDDPHRSARAALRPTAGPSRRTAMFGSTRLPAFRARFA